MEKRRSSLCVVVFLYTLLFFFPASLLAKSPPFKNATFPRLVETEELVPVVGHPSVRVIDMRSSLQDYQKSHLPNAIYLHFENLRVPRNGIPAQMPDRIFLEKLLGSYLSLSNSMWVILYSDKSNPNATFLAWVLEYLGHKKTGVLNGGWEKWSQEKLPVTQAYPSLQPQKFFGKIIRETFVEKKWIRDHSASKGVVIVDARSPKLYSGEEDEGARRGHIPGARNIFWEATLEGDETRIWKKREELERLLAESGIERDKEILVYCNTGRKASHLYFTLKHVLRFPAVRLYQGSWMEWSADRDVPVKTGMDP